MLVEGVSMITSGIARKVDDLGRIVLPVEMRRLFGIRAGDALDISVDDRGIVLRKVETRCVFCDSSEALRSYRDKQLCAACAVELGAAAPTDKAGNEPETSRAHFFEGLPTAAEFAEHLPSPSKLTPAAEEIEQALAAGEVETVSEPPEVQGEVVDAPSWES